MPYLLREKDIAYTILPTSATMIMDPIDAPWDGATLVVGAHCLHNVDIAYSNAVNTIATFLDLIHQKISS